MDSGDLQFSLEGKMTSIKFFKDINQVHIIVEDAGKEAEYETIFKRLLNKEYKIEKIFAVGGKINVKRCYEELKDDSSLPLIFLVDGDFDRYKDPENMINDERFIYLETYNIESYFIDEKASAMFVKSCIHLLDEEIDRKFRFKEWKESIIEHAKDLFFIYCYLQIYNPTEPNVQKKPCYFVNQENGFWKTDDSFEKYKIDIYAKDENAQTRIEEIVHKYLEIHGTNYSYLICGKFLFFCLKNYIHHIVDKAINDNTLRWWLIYHFDIEKLSYVRDRINVVYPNAVLH